MSVLVEKEEKREGGKRMEEDRTGSVCLFVSVQWQLQGALLGGRRRRCVSLLLCEGEVPEGGAVAAAGSWF